MTQAVSQQSTIFGVGKESREEKISRENAALAGDFADFMKMSLAEKIRAQYLADHNLTEDELAAMPPEERKKIEDEIEKAVKLQLGLDAKNKAAQDEAASNSLQSKLADLSLVIE